MSIPESIKQFIKWIQGFDHRILQNEDDVKEKFILPMFHYLCYPETFCREYSLHTRNSELAEIYFSNDDVEQQNADTSLIMIKAMEPHNHNFNDILKRAKFYGNYCNTKLFIITNGYKINVFKHLLYHQEESVFDINIDLLKNAVVASSFYNKLNFNLVKNINQSTRNVLINAKYNLLENIIRSQPDLQDVLEKRDFEPCTWRQDYRLVVVKPKVAIACNLPKAFGEGNCKIEFSNILLRGLKINLNHQDILSQLMTGLNTQPDWGCRRFLKQLDKDYFEVNLGKTTVLLSELETLDLCLCIDGICQEYKKIIIEFENVLETWDFEFTEFSNIRGFILFSVGQKLWKLMQQFADEFNYTKGKSEWHLFYYEGISIRVSRGIRDHAFILPKIDSDLSLLANDKINIVYKLNDVYLQFFERVKITSWQQDIGLRGTWTARYTKQWLLEKYIPKVINYYLDKFQVSEAELLAEIINYQGEHLSIKEINDIINLLPYLRYIQSWLHIYKENIAASLLQDYYQTFTDLVRNTDCSIIGIDYIMRNLLRIKWKNTQEEIPSNSKHLNFKHAMDCLDEQVARINNSEYENSFKADLITRTFIWIIENGKISFSQAQLNAAKQALQPLWEQSRFEMRHVYLNR